MHHSTAPGIRKDQHSEHDFDESFFRDVALGGPGLTCIISDTDHSIVFSNHSFSALFGISTPEQGGLLPKFTDLLDPYMLDRFSYQLHSTSAGDIFPGFVIYELRIGSGEKVPFYVYASEFAGDKPGMYHLVMHPYLSRWSSPFISFDTNEMFLEHFDSEDFGTFEWIPGINKVVWSQGLYRIYEADNFRHELNNLYALAFIHQKDKTRVKNAVIHAINNNLHLDIEFRIVTAKNQIKTIHCLARMIRNPDGTPSKFAGSIRDVTRQREISEDLKHKVEELNHSNKELEEFAYVASHDLQEPLRKITTFGDRLADKYRELLTGEGSMYLSRIISSTENMRLLISDLLEFSKISKTEQPFEQVNLNVVLKEVQNDLEITIEETATGIISTRLPMVEAVFSQMKQLFSNILSNAIKFRQQGVAPAIRIDSRELTEPEKVKYELNAGIAYVQVEITDNGIGFENEYSSRIFQVFQRLHGKSEYPGSGIGLAICKKIIEYHHGVIFADSRPGNGSHFTFILPVGQRSLHNGQ